MSEMTLEWKLDPHYEPDHFIAETPFGVYRIGPCRDGAWEYCTPDERWGDHNAHMLDDLTRDEAFAAVEAKYRARATDQPASEGDE